MTASVLGILESAENVPFRELGTVVAPLFARLAGLIVPTLVMSDGFVAPLPDGEPEPDGEQSVRRRSVAAQAARMEMRMNFRKMHDISYL